MVLVWPPIFYRPANYEEHENHLKNDGRKKREKERGEETNHQLFPCGNLRKSWKDLSLKVELFESHFLFTAEAAVAVQVMQHVIKIVHMNEIGVNVEDCNLLLCGQKMWRDFCLSSTVSSNSLLCGKSIMHLPRGGPAFPWKEVCECRYLREIVIGMARQESHVQDEIWPFLFWFYLVLYSPFFPVSHEKAYNAPHDYDDNFGLLVGDSLDTNGTNSCLSCNPNWIQKYI